MENINIEEIVEQVLSELKQATDMTIPVEISARHVHLSAGDAMALFGHPVTPEKELSQPGQFLCRERVRLIGPRGVMDNVAVLGPARSDIQVEISLTDARALGIKTPVRQSGDVGGSPGIILSTPKKIIGIEHGVIVAGRHIHMSPRDAERLNVRNRDLVCVRLDTQRPVVFRDVLVRVDENFRLTMHIDADEANGCGCDNTTRCRIIQDDMGGLCQHGQLTH